MRVSGTSGGVGFESVAVSTTARILIDTATNATAAGDVVTATASALLAVAATGFDVRYGPNTANNVLNLDAQGRDVVIDRVSLRVAGAQPVFFDRLGRINLTNPGLITVIGEVTADVIDVTATGTSSGSLRLNAGPTVTFNTLTGLVVTGNGGGDRLTVRNPAGTLFAPTAGVRFDAGATDDGTLELLGGGTAAFSETYTAGPAAFAGSARFSGPVGVEVAFTGVRQLTDSVSVTAYTATASEGADTITLDDGEAAGDGRARLAMQQFATVHFSNKTNLVLRGGATAADPRDLIYVSLKEASAGLTTATVAGGAGDDAIQVFFAPLAVPMTLEGNDGHDLIAVKASLAVPFTIRGGAGDDDLYGGAAADVIDTGSGTNTARGGGGNDTITGGAGDDLLYGDEGDDELRGGTGTTTAFGGVGDDRLFGGSGPNTLHGGDGTDQVTGGASADTLHGDAGNDTLRGGGSADTLHGGDGDDTAVRRGRRRRAVRRGRQQHALRRRRRRPALRRPRHRRPGRRRRERPAPGRFGDANARRRRRRRRRGRGGPGLSTITGGPGHDILLGGGRGDIDGGPGNDILVGPAQGATLAAGEGDDRVYGRAGGNVITGGPGNDVLDAGPGGGNTVRGDLGSDVVLGRGPSDAVFGFDSGGPEPGATVDYVYPSSALSNPAPAYAPLPAPFEADTLPAGPDYRGRWTEFSGSATGAGLSGFPGAATEPSLAAGTGGQYVAMADQRSGTSVITVARHTAAGWAALPDVGPGRKPSLALDASR